jgi:hypothetical protein
MGNASYFAAETNNEVPKIEENNEQKQIVENNYSMEENNIEIPKTNNVPKIIDDNEQLSVDNNGINAESFMDNMNENIEENEANPSESKKWFGRNIFSDKKERNIFSLFIIPPFIISLISAYHLIDFFGIGNIKTISIILGFAFEMASVSSLLGIVVLKKLKTITKFFLWAIIVGLYFLQFIGNVFAVFSFITPESAKKMYDFIGLAGNVNDQRVVSYIVGGVLTVVAFSLTKIASDYIRNKK